jgi:hypothetical protein
MEIFNCSFVNFLFFETILNNDEGTQGETDEVDRFPYINGIEVTYINTLIDDPTEFVLNATLFRDIDRRALDVRYANRTLITNCTGIRTGGRSLESSAAYWIEGNPVSHRGYIEIAYNNLTQVRAVTYPFLGELVMPSYTSMMWVTGLNEHLIDGCEASNFTVDQCEASPTLGCCPVLSIHDNIVCGLPYALRLVGSRESLNSWIHNGLPSNWVIKFDDDLSGIREIAFRNQANIDGTVCDIVLGEPSHDFREEHVSG